MGNRIKRIWDGKEEIYHYNNKNQLLQIEKENDTIFYKYDNQGNTLEEKSSKGTTTYTYDIYNRTKEVITETGDHIKNSYTPLGLRYKKEVNGVVSRYIVDDWNIIAEVDKENNIKSREVRGYELLKKEVENKDYFYHTNEHGDVTYLSNIAGEIENSYSYDVFGNIKEQKEAISNQFKYTGEQYDSEVQQYYLRARFYNPTIGRFTQEDVYRDDGLNLYVYVINNPLLWVDPSGYAKCSQNNEQTKIRAYEGIDPDVLNAKYDIKVKKDGKEKVFKDMSVKLNEDLVVEMPYKGKGKANANGAGYLRDAKYYFKELHKKHPEYFSPANKKRLENKRNLVNDPVFRSYFPEYDVKGLRGNRLIHHHIGGGGQAVAVPSGIHHGYGGIHNNEKQLGIWHNNVEPPSQKSQATSTTDEH